MKKLFYGADVGCFRSFPALPGVILYLLAFLKHSETFHLDVGVMDEEVVSAAVRSDEPITLFFTEPLYRTRRH